MWRAPVAKRGGGRARRTGFRLVLVVLGRAGFDQHARDLCVALFCCPVQRGPAVLRTTRGGHRSTPSDTRAHGAIHPRARERRVRRACEREMSAAGRRGRVRILIRIPSSQKRKKSSRTSWAHHDRLSAADPTPCLSCSNSNFSEFCHAFPPRAEGPRSRCARDHRPPRRVLSRVSRGGREAGWRECEESGRSPCFGGPWPRRLRPACVRSRCGPVLLPSAAGCGRAAHDARWAQAHAERHARGRCIRVRESGECAAHARERRARSGDGPCQNSDQNSVDPESEKKFLDVPDPKRPPLCGGSDAVSRVRQFHFL